MNDSILCRARVQLSPTVTGEMLFMPAGEHEISPASGGIDRPIKVLVDAQGAAQLETQRQALEAKGRPPYFDFDHQDQNASFWPKSFVWRDGEGIVAQGTWTERGKTSVEGKEYRYFSPVFYVDNKRGNPARIECRMTARANMGALINDPAFHQISPLWAKNAGDNGDAVNNNNGETNMTPEEIAELRAKLTELQDEVKALKAKNAPPAQVDPIEAQAAKIEAEIALANEQARSKKLEDEIKAKREKDADGEIYAAIKRGAILPRDTKLQQTLKANAVADPERGLAVIKAMRGDAETLEGKVVGSRVFVTGEDPRKILSKMSAIVARQRKLERGSRARRTEEMAKHSREFAAIYASEISPISAPEQSRRILAMPVQEVLEAELQAADVTDSDYGTLAGTLVAQRVLEFLKFAFPMLTSFSADFSAEGATFGQTVMTRTVDVPEVVTYNTTTGWP